MKKLLITLATIVSFILFTGISGCEHKSPTAVTELSCVPGNVEFETVTGYGGERQNWVITNQTEWENYVNSALGIIFPSGRPSSPVDFSNKMIISVRMGWSGNSNSLIEIKAIETDCELVTVKIIERDTSYCTGWGSPGSSTPNHTLVIDKTDLTINFLYLGWDNDGDGYVEGEETAAGTDPCDPNDHP